MTEHVARRAIVLAFVTTVLVASMPVAHASPGECTRVVGFSQTRNWYLSGSFESMPGVSNAEWELLALGGIDLQTLADPASAVYSRPVESPCGISPTRVLLHAAFADYRTATDADIAATLSTAVVNIRSAWPTVTRVDVSPIAGGPGHTTCPLTETRDVEATTMHPRIDAAIALVANGVDLLAGPDLLVSACADFTDAGGHLTTAGSEFVATQVAQHYSAPVSTTPDAISFAAATTVDVPLALTLTGTDLDGDPLAFAVATGPLNGTLGPVSAPTCSATTCTAAVTYTPNANYVGSDQFTYTVTDGSATSAPTTVDLTVDPEPTAIAFRAAASSTTIGATSLAVPAPAGVQPGDVLIAVIAVRGNPTVTPSSGWTLLRNTGSGIVMHEVAFFHVAGGSEPGSYTWTFSVSQAAVGEIVAYSGVDPVSPIDVSGGQSNASSTQVTAPSVITAGPGELLLGIFGFAASTTFSPPVQMLERTEASTAGARRNVSLEIAEESLAGAGATGTRVAVAINAAVNVGQVVALRPA